MRVSEAMNCDFGSCKAEVRFRANDAKLRLVFREFTLMKEIVAGMTFSSDFDAQQQSGELEHC